MKRVYFLRPVGQLGPIKIGCSIQPELRLDSLTIWSPVRLELICSVPGQHKDERTLHGMFAKHRLHGEWFGASKELLALIDHCSATGCLPELPKVLAFPSTQHVGFRGRAKGKIEPRPLKEAKLELARTIRAQYDSGLSSAALAKEHGLSVLTVLRYVRAAGGTVRPRGGGYKAGRDANPERTAEMARRYRDGETLQAIGDDYGLTRERVRQLLRKADVVSFGLRDHHKQKAHPLTDAEIEAARLYESGVAPKVIAERVGLSVAQIAYACRRQGVEPKGAGFWLTLPNDAEITARTCELYQAGKSASEIVALVPELKFPETVYRYLKKGGVPPRHPMRRNRLEAHAPSIVELYRRGSSQTQIARQFETSAGAIHNLLKRHDALRRVA